MSLSVREYSWEPSQFVPIHSLIVFTNLILFIVYLKFDCSTLFVIINLLKICYECVSLVDMSVYLNRIEGLTFFDRNMSEDLEVFEDDGRARSQGFELLVSKRWGQFQSWLNYTLSENEYQFSGLHNA